MNVAGLCLASWAPRGWGSQTQNAYFSLLTYTNQLLLVTYCHISAENGVSFRTHTDGTTHTDEQTDVEVEIVIQIHTLIHLSARLNSDSVNFRGLIAGNPCEIRNVLPIAIFISSASKPLKNPWVPTIIGRKKTFSLISKKSTRCRHNVIKTFVWNSNPAC